jgi:hypothetical protein
MKNVIIFMVMLAFIACQKTGPIGPAGTNGANGLNGTNGKDGNANVKSLTVSIAPSIWSGTSSTGYFYSYPVPDITADIANKGLVLGYLQSSNGGWLAMPWTSFYSTYSTQYNYTYYTGYFQAQIKDSDLISIRPTATLSFKIVIIAASGLKADVDYTSYSAVRKAYNLDAIEASKSGAEN